MVKILPLFLTKLRMGLMRESQTDFSLGAEQNECGQLAPQRKEGAGSDHLCPVPPSILAGTAL
jgi:hypothetical protein